MVQPRAQPRFEQPKPDHIYSIVIYPQGPQAEALQKSLDELADTYGGTKVPVHLTLMGGLVDDLSGAEERARLLASQLKVQRIFFDKVVSRPVKLHGKPFQSVAVSVDGEIGFGEADIIEEQQEKLLGPNGLLHPAEYTISELTLVETTDDDPTKWQALGKYKLSDEAGPSS